MVRRIVSAVSLLVLALLVRDASADAPRVRIVGKVESGRTVVVEGAGGPRSVLALPPSASVERLIVSPSGKHAFLFAQLAPHQSRTAYIVDLAQAKVTASYHPGLGGTFFFSSTDAVVQVAGCGNACAALEVRDWSGRSLGAYDCAGFDPSSEVSPDRRYAACFGSAKLDVVDLATGRPAMSAATPCTIMGQRDGVRWEGSSSVRFTCYDDEASDAVDVVASWSSGGGEITKRAVQAP